MTIFTFPSNTIGGGGGGGGGTTTGGGGLEVSTVKNSNFTAEEQKAYPIDTSSNYIEATLPETPTEGSKIGFFDYSGNADPTTPTGLGANELQITPSGSDTILGVSDSLVINADNEACILVYNSGRWSIYSGTTSSSGNLYNPAELDFILAELMKLLN